MMCLSQAMTPLVVMATTVAMCLLLPAAGDVSSVSSDAWNTSSTYNVTTEAPGNSSVTPINQYRVSNRLALLAAVR